MTETTLHPITHYFGNTFHSLGNRNFRYFWTGQCVSLIGTTMQRTAQYWLVYTLTSSPLAVGMLGVCQFLPMLLFSLPAGALIDRIPKRPLLIVTQALFMAQAIALTVLTWTGAAQYWHILVLSALYGITQTFDMPARQTFLYDLVGPADIMNAVSLNSTIVNVSKIFGPALAGLVMLHLGIPACFLINAASFIAVIGGLLMIRVPRAEIRRAQARVWREISDGLHFIRSQSTLIACILIFGIVSTFALNLDVIAPVFADSVLGRGANGYTGLLTAAGVGSLIGALFMASRSRLGVKGRLLIFGGAATALLQLLTVCTTSYYISLALLTLIGFANIVFLNTANALFQTSTPDEYRARVMSIYSLLLLGSTPIGNFFAGAVMDNIPGDSGFIACGAVTLLLLVPVLIGQRSTVSKWMRGHAQALPDIREPY
jgi:MFS family permease